MKPIRIKMAHQMISGYGLYKKMDVYEPHCATLNELINFHSDDYINYIETVSKKYDTSNIQKQCN
jgi:acetoin utilization deacetylase AcuC-like enzyme